jgi:hypothetical protein
MSDPASPFSVPLDPESPWPKFKRDAAGTGRSPITPRVTDERPWEVKTELGVFSPAVIDGDGDIYMFANFKTMSVSELDIKKQ